MRLLHVAHIALECDVKSTTQAVVAKNKFGSKMCIIRHVNRFL